MSYAGVKFQTRFLKKTAPDDTRLGELINWCRVFHEKDLAPPYEGGSFGNLSYRTQAGKNEFIITGSRMGLKDNPGPEAFVRVLDVDMDNTVISAEGLREPSSETMLHYSIYKTLPEINAVFHGHCQMILDMAGQMNIPQTEKFIPYGTREMVDGFLAILDKGRFLIIREHGFVGLGQNMQRAGELCLEKLEQCTAAKGGNHHDQ